jgi:hypothetical protein
MKSLTTTESVILPACCKIVNTMFGASVYKKNIFKIPMPDNTIRRHIQDESQDVELQVVANNEVTEFFTVQLDESTDIKQKAQPLTFSRFCL